MNTRTLARLPLLVCLMAVSTMAPTPLYAQSPPAQNQTSNNAGSMEIIAAWQNSSRAPTPAGRAALIEKALALAVPANPWPFSDPSRDDLLGRMWGQLGNEYRRVDGPDRADALDRAIRAYNTALKHIPMSKGQDWARVQYGLAMAYIDWPQGDRAENIEQGIAAFGRAAEIMTKASAPSLWADIQIFLSKAYWHRIKGLRGDNLEQSLAHAEAALSVLSKEKSPADWASAQQAIGAAHFGRIKGNRSSNIEKAIAAYEQALALVSRERSPKTWAGLNENIAMAYAVRPHGDDLDNRNLAAKAFERAGEIFTRDKYPSEWAQLNMNWGNLRLSELPGNQAEHIEAAIAHFTNALTIYTPAAFPERSARVQLNLGIAHARRIKGEPAANIENAIAAYRDALRYYTQANDPPKWAIVQNNLAIALRARSRGNRQENLATAAAAHEAALRIHTVEAFPIMHLRSTYNAGEAAAARGDWATASSFYQRAMDVSAQLFSAGLDRAEATAVITDATGLFASAAYAAIRRNAPTEAINHLESGKARLLKATMQLDNVVLPPPERERINRLRDEVRTVENMIEATVGNERQQAVSALEGLRRAIATILDKAAAAQPPIPNGADIAKSLLSDYAAIAMPLITEHGSVLLLVTLTNSNTPNIQVFELPAAGQSAMTRFLLGSDPTGKIGGWLGAYSINHLPANAQSAQRPAWLAAISNLGPALGQMIGTTLAAALDKAAVPIGSSVLWIPQGALGVLPIGIANIAGTNNALLDLYRISTAPSLAATEQTRTRATTATSERSLTAVINPTADLPSTLPEGEAAAAHFAPTRRQQLGANNATRETVLAALAKSNHWHFATHATFNWQRPRQSALQLANGTTLTLGNLLDQTNMGTPRLVVLSACETGIFDFQRKPDEFTGLPTAFLQAGAAGVLGSLWPVDDASTALLMIQFYNVYIAERAPPAEALRKSQIWLRDASRQQLTAFVSSQVSSGRLSKPQGQTLQAALAGGNPGDKPFSHPFYWAAFQFYGS
jgi:CHAT domain-containing protein/tetratricopeptide (TPR) repeat protein